MREMNAHCVTITMRDGSVFHGYINIGSCRRLSDFVTKADASTFVVMFETTIDESKEKNVYFINRDHILSVRPNEMDDRRCLCRSFPLEGELEKIFL